MRTALDDARLSSSHFTPEHDTLRQVVRRFVETEITPHVDAWEAEGAIPRDVFRRMGELGFLGLRFPEAYGGAGRDYFAAVVVAEELCRCGAGSLPMAVGVQTEMVTPPILKFGTEDQKQRYLVPAIRGEKIGALAITEPGAGSDVAGLRTTAAREGSGFRLTGSKTFITNGVAADFVLVVAKTAPAAGHRGFSLFLVDRDTPGFHVARKLDKVGMRASDTAELFFDSCLLPAGALLGEEHHGFFHLMWELQGERMIAAVGAVAFAQMALDLALRYASERVQFGRPIGTFQTVRHKLARMAAQVEGARRFTYATARQFDRGEYPVAEISMAKLATARMACRVIDDALQIFGGYGYMADYPIERLWRDTRLYRIGGGADEIMREIIARERLDQSAGRPTAERRPFSDEHHTFRHTVRAFVQREIIPHVEDWERAEAIPRQLFRSMADAGYLGIQQAEAYGGSEAGPLYDAVFHEEIARCGSGSVAAAVGAHTGLAMPLLARLGTEEQKQRYLAPAIQGKLIGALAITEPDAGSDVAGLRTTATCEANGYRLAGTKIFITNGVTADFVIVAAKTDPRAGNRGISLFIVEKDTPGFSVSRKLKKLGWRASDTAELAFDGCLIPAANLLGEEHRGFFHLIENFKWERLLIALQSVVTAELALETALAHARARVVFGKPLIEFQAIRHRLADCATDLEVARALTDHALVLFAAGEECAKEIAMAKLIATETACTITDEALQFHGGYGYMMEYPIQRLWRDARLGRIGGGTSEIMAEVIADRLGLPQDRRDG